MTKKLPAVACLLLSCLVVAKPARAADEFEARVFQGEGGEKLAYRLLKPANYDPSRQYPLVVFLHGAGERGTDNAAQLKHVAWIFVTAENRAKFPCFVLAPQCPASEQWVNVPWGAERHRTPEQPSRPMWQTMRLIGELEKEFRIDPARRYAIGLSMGGFGVWDALARYPDEFAAGVPICGGGDETRAAAVAKTPVWAFHGDKDTVVKTSRSRNMVDALQKAGAKPKYTEYPGVGHDAWSRAPDR